MDEETKRQAQKFEHERLQSQAEFSNILEKSKIDKEIKWSETKEVAQARPNASNP